MNIKLNEFLRYFCIGIVHLFCISVLEFDITDNVPVIFDNYVFQFGFIIAIGAITYIFYRVFLYNNGITRIMDFYYKRTGQESYRIILKNTYKLSHIKAINFYRIIRDKYVENKRVDIKENMINCHLGYMTSSVIMIYSICSFFSKNNACTTTKVVLIFFSVLLFIASFIFDKTIEDEETFEFRNFDKFLLDKTYYKFFEKQKFSDNNLNNDKE